MLTARGWWLLFVIFLLLMFGIQASHPALAVLGFALLIWFAWEWFVFTLRRHFVLSKLYLERTVSDERGPIKLLWAGRIFRVHTRLRLPVPLRLPFVFSAEQLPFEAERLDGNMAGQGPVSDREAVELTYRLRCDKVGVVRFEGVRIQVADFQGFFNYTSFVQLPALYHVLPIVHDVDGMSAVAKERNQLLPPGVHRLRSGGSGSELLDLRDYMTGDPPKTIAWKVSARRDRLITKVFENEVPIRCTLFVDVSSSVRVPSLHGTALQRLIEIAGSVMRANTHIRDLTGLCLFDEQGVQYAAPDRRAAHLNRLLQMLADAAGLPPTSSRADPEPLIPLAYRFASEVYPELMTNELNEVPFWLTGITRFPTYTRRVHAMARLLNSRPFWLFVFSLPTVGPVLYGLILMLTVHQRRLQRWRKRLAALLSARYGLAPGGLAALLEDDDAFSLLVQRFLAEHHVPFRLPLYGLDGRYLFAAPEKIPLLAGALRRSIGRGRDNELFVLLADLLEVDDKLDALLSVVHVALSRHHQVLIVCPWPPGLPLPELDPADVQNKPPPTLAGLLRRSTRRRYHTAFYRLRRTFGRLGVQVICAASNEAVPVILERINRLRTLRRTPR
jgi:uncharacterized protein (DUF58 family)